MIRESILAINGGEKCIPDGMIKAWPSIDDIDKEYVKLADKRIKKHIEDHSLPLFEKKQIAKSVV